MSTQPQIQANRLNAQKSTGPKTQKGKQIVAQNALKHGLSARHDVIVTESQADFDLHRDSLLEELDPQSPMESMLADRIVSLSWRLKRADRIQNQTFDAMDEDNKSNPFPNLTKALARKGLNRPTPQTADPQHDLTLGRIALKDFANARVLDRLLMYERRIENSLHKTLLELQRLNLIRNLAPSDQIELNSPRLARGPVPRVPTDQNKTPAPPPFSRRRNLSRGDDDAESTDRPQSPKPQTSTPPTQNDIRHPTYNIRKNKPNLKNPKNNPTPFTTKPYNKIPPRPHKKKQTQTNPIHPTQTPGQIEAKPRSRFIGIRKTIFPGLFPVPLLPIPTRCDPSPRDLFAPAEVPSISTSESEEMHICDNACLQEMSPC